MLLLQISGIVVAQAIVEGDRARDFPGILDKKAELRLSHARAGGTADADVVHQAEKKAGVAQSDVGPSHRSGLKGLARFGLSKIVNAQSVAIDDGRITFSAKLAAELVSVISFHPSSASVEGWTLGDGVGAGFRADAHHAAGAA